MNKSIADIRRDYSLESLNEAEVAANAFDQFANWWNEAIKSNIDEVNAMTLATATPDGIPSARIVLLKGYDKKGFVFFTNYDSHKGQQLAANPNASLLFFWKELERQIRIDGIVKKVSEEESELYYQSRPTGSRIGAWASPQSEVIEDRSVIENNYLTYEKKFGTHHIPRPEHWGGYVLAPTTIELWQGRSSRLHDRLRYQLQSNGEWLIERLAP